MKRGKGGCSRQRREHIGKPKEKRKYIQVKKSLATTSEKVSVLKANDEEVIVRLQENRVLNTQKSGTFLCTTNEKVEFEIKKSPFIYISTPPK